MKRSAQLLTIAFATLITSGAFAASFNDIFISRENAGTYKRTAPDGSSACGPRCITYWSHLSNGESGGDITRVQSSIKENGTGRYDEFHWQYYQDHGTDWNPLGGFDYKEDGHRIYRSNTKYYGSDPLDFYLSTYLTHIYYKPDAGDNWHHVFFKASWCVQ